MQLLYHCVENRRRQYYARVIYMISRKRRRKYLVEASVVPRAVQFGARIPPTLTVDPDATCGPSGHPTCRVSESKTESVSSVGISHKGQREKFEYFKL